MRSKIILLAGFLLFVAAAHPQLYGASQAVYRLHVEYTNGTLLPLNVTLEEAYIPETLNLTEDVYRISLISLENTTLYENTFVVPKSFIADPGPDCFDENGEIIPGKCPDIGLHELEEVTTFVDIPYYPRGAKIAVDDRYGNRLFAVNVENFASVCGNSRCDMDENTYLCPADCPVQKGEMPEEDIIIIGAVLIAVLLLGALYYKK